MSPKLRRATKEKLRPGRTDSPRESSGVKGGIIDKGKGGGEKKVRKRESEVVFNGTSDAPGSRVQRSSSPPSDALPQRALLALPELQWGEYQIGGKTDFPRETRRNVDGL